MYWSIEIFTAKNFYNLEFSSNMYFIIMLPKSKYIIIDLSDFVLIFVIVVSYIW